MSANNNNKTKIPAVDTVRFCIACPLGPLSPQTGPGTISTQREPYIATPPNFLRNMHLRLGAGDFCRLLCAVLGGCTDEGDRRIACSLCLEGENAHRSRPTHACHARRP